MCPGPNRLFFQVNKFFLQGKSTLSQSDMRSCNRSPNGSLTKLLPLVSLGEIVVLKSLATMTFWPIPESNKFASEFQNYRGASHRGAAAGTGRSPTSKAVSLRPGNSPASGLDSARPSGLRPGQKQKKNSYSVEQKQKKI